MVKASVDDFVLVQGEKNTPLLVRVTANSQGICKGVLSNKQEAYAETVQKVDFNTNDIIANLGTDPRFGTAYGVKIQPYVDHAIIKYMGNIFYYRKVTDKERIRIENRFLRLGKRLKEDGLVNAKEFELTVKPFTKGSKHVGFYTHFKKPEKPDELCLCGPEFSPTDMEYLMCHEYAHGLWFNNFDPHLQTRWLKAFSRNVAMVKIRIDQLETIRVELVNAGNLRALRGQFDDESKAAFIEAMKFIKRTHSLEPRHINALLEDGDDLQDYWPKIPLGISHKTVLVSDYAITAPDEFWCEAFGFYYSKYKPIPKSLHQLMIDTLANIKATNGASAADDGGYAKAA